MKINALFRIRFFMHVIITLVLVICVVIVSYELFSSWVASLLLGISVILVYKYFKGKNTRSMWRLWEKYFAEKAIDSCNFNGELVCDGVGFISGYTVMFSVDASKSGLKINNKWAVETKYIFLGWEDVSNIVIKMYRYDGMEQKIAEIFLSDYQSCRLVIPWNEVFKSVIPRGVGYSEGGINQSI